MLTLNGHKLTPTVFPDKTSQVWQLPDWLIKGNSKYLLDWRWESESEILQIMQLMDLIKEYCNNAEVELYAPYLPYARQDKLIRNEESFALNTFTKIINGLNFKVVKSLDVHNPIYTDRLVDKFFNIPPVAFHTWALDKVKPDIIVFPDHGAFTRYPHLWDLPHAKFRKQRDQATGKIVGHELEIGDGYFNKAKARVLVVDDICDGGATFLSVAKAIKGINSSLELHLAVTHGIYSKGLGDLCRAFESVLNTDSYIDGNTIGAFEV